MATKTKVFGDRPVEQLTGTIHGNRFLIVLDDIRIADKWAVDILSRLQADGVGKPALQDGYTVFEFKDSNRSKVWFDRTEDVLTVTKFTVFGELDASQGEDGEGEK